MAAPKNMSHVEDRLREVLDYEPQSGLLRWKLSIGKRIKAGRPVGNLAANGRIYFQIDGERLLAHRAVWFLHYGVWPKENLSARNGDYTDLRIDNFEELDAQQVALKGGGKRPGISGVPGVSWDKERGKWLVQIVRGYETRYVGRFSGLEEAKEAHARACEEAGVDLQRIVGTNEARERSDKAKLRAKQRIAWKRTQAHAGGVTGWKSFLEFVHDLGGAEPSGFVLLPVNPDAPVGPGNFRWVEAPSKAYDRLDKESVAAFNKQWRSENPAHIRHKSLLWNFGLTLAEYQEMLLSQKGVCAICGNPETDVRAGKVRALAVDHCHTTGKIRELLCRGCNQGLGNFGEDLNRLVNAIAYLQKHQSRADDDCKVVPFTKT